MRDGLFDDEDGADEGGAARATWAKGKDIPLAELVAATRARIQMHLRLAGVSDADAEDLIQESLLSVCLHWHEIKSPEAYLYSTVRRQVRLLRRRRERAAEMSLDQVAAAAGLPAVPAIQEASDRRRDLERLLDGLPARARQVLTMQYGEQLTAQEIGVVMGCAAPAIRQTASRAMDRLRRRARALKLS